MCSQEETVNEYSNKHLHLLTTLLGCSIMCFRLLHVHISFTNATFYQKDLGSGLGKSFLGGTFAVSHHM